MPDISPSERVAEPALAELLGEFDTRPADGEPVCALCRLERRSAERWLKSFLAEYVNDEPVRLRWRAARGLCSAHASILAEVGDPLGVAILYADLAEVVHGAWNSPPRRLFRRRLRQADCPGCEAQESASKRYAAALAAALGTEEVRMALESGTRLCVSHVEQTARCCSHSSAAEFRRAQCRSLAELRSELLEIVRKNDYRFRGEEWGPERDAWLRALSLLTRHRR